MKKRIQPNHQAKRAQPRPKMVWFPRLSMTACIVLAVFTLAGCGTFAQRVHLPPVTEAPAGSIQEGRFVWIDLLTEDVVIVEQSIATARESGGSLILKSGNVAVLADPTGAAFGIQAH